MALAPLSQIAKLAQLSDVTTTPEAPPQFRALEREPANLGRDMRYPVGGRELQERAMPELRPFRCDLPAVQVFEIVQAAALEAPRWSIVAVESDRLQLEATVTSRWLRRRDDLVIQVRAEPDGASVHVRCKARGDRRGPFGVRRRIAEFLARLCEMLA